MRKMHKLIKTTSLLYKNVFGIWCCVRLPQYDELEILEKSAKICLFYSVY